MSEQMNENQVTEEVKVESNVEKISFFTKVKGVLLLVAFIFLAVIWLRNTISERSFYMEMYGYAVDEVREKYVGVLNLRIDDYKEEYIRSQPMEYQDFGYGELRYFKYAVKVPVEYDTTFEHCRQDITITVYFYTSNQNVIDGIDESVPAHFHIVDMYSELYELFG